MFEGALPSGPISTAHAHVAGFIATESAVRFQSCGSGFDLLLSPEEARILPACPARRCRSIGLRLSGGRRRPRLVPEDPLPATGRPTFASVLYEEVYPGIGLRFLGHAGELRHSFHVDRGASPDSILLELEGVDRLDVDETGALAAEGAGARLLLPRPQGQQTAAGQRIDVAARYVIRGRKQVALEVGAYDVRLPLVVRLGRPQWREPHS